MKKWLLSIAISLTAIAMTTIDAEAKNVLITYEKPQDLLLIKQALPHIEYDDLSGLKLLTADVSSEELQKLKNLPLDLTIESDEGVEHLQDNPIVTPLWNLQALKVGNAWNQQYTGKDIKVAVIDTGINTISGLPNVKNRVSFATDDKKTTINEADLIDRGHNGRGHGTMVASIIAGQALAKHQFSGVAPNAELYAVKYADGTKNGVASGLIKSINWSIEQNMDIINISSGLTVDLKSLHNVIKKAANQGILIIASAGNDGQDAKLRYPANYPEVISVGSINKYMDISSFSNSADAADFTAPGEEVTALTNSGIIGLANGTSFSAPHITGLFALYKERYPFSSRQELVNFMLNTKSSGKTPQFKVKNYEEIMQTMPVSVRAIKDHQADLVIDSKVLQNGEKVVILLDNKIVNYTTKSSYRLTNLLENKEHEATVRIVDNNGNWSKATTQQFKTLKDVTAPPRVSKLQASILTNGVVSLSWKQTKPSDFSHTIIYENNVKLATTSNKSYVTTNSIKVKKRYSYKIITVDKSGNRSKARTVSITRY